MCRKDAPNSSAGGIQHFTGKSCQPKRRWNSLKTLQRVRIWCISCLSFAFPWWVACCQLCSHSPAPSRSCFPWASPAWAVPCGFWALVSSAALGQSPAGAAVGERSSQRLSLLQVLRVLAKIFRIQRSESTNSVKAWQSFGTPPPAPWLWLVRGLSSQSRVDPQGNRLTLPHSQFWSCGQQISRCFLGGRARQSWVICSSPKYRICHSCSRQGKKLKGWVQQLAKYSISC